MSLIYVSCFLTIFWTLNWTAKAENDELYKTVQREKQSLMRQTQHSFMTQKSCKNSCGEISMRRLADDCHCDQQCVDFGDCCLDYWQSCNSSFIKAYNKRRIFECIVHNLKLSNKTISEAKTSINYEVVSKCPLAFENVRIKNACENPEQENGNVSPFVEGADGNTYRNQYCAECNDISMFKRWNTSLQCPTSKETEYLLKNRLRKTNFAFTSAERKQIRENCFIKMDPPYGVEKSRCRMVTECEDTASPDYMKCRAYKLQLYSMFPLQVFKNPHCARCSKFPLMLLTSFIPFSAGVGSPASLSVLFDFTKSSQIFGLKEIRIESECESDEIYDFQLKKCRKKRILSTPLLNWTCPFANETFPNSSESIQIHKNLSIFVVSHNRMYKQNEYKWHENNVTVCGNLTVKYLKTTVQKLDKLYTKAESLITVIGLTLSIIALLAVLITYFLFAELRSKLPGKIIINLAMALVSAQSVFLVDMFSELKGHACVVIAVLLQFLYLAAFCWMNVMAFDVSRTFAGKSHRSPSRSRNKVFVLCFIYAWGLPLLITGLTLIFNHAGVINVAYGNNYYCWITNPVALVIFFVVPVVAMLLFNIVALVRVLVAVRRVRKVTKKVRDESTAGQDARMCWKLTAVFGLTWILCVAAEHHIALRIIYIIFNSLQGVFIMFSFIMTKRVLNMYLKKAGREPLTTSGMTQKSTIPRSEVTRRTSSAPLVDRKPVEKRRREIPEHAIAVNDKDSPETKVLISSLEGPETSL